MPDSIEPIGTGSCDEDAGEKISDEFVVASCSAPEVLEPAPHAHDTVAVTVGGGVVGNWYLPGDGGRDDRLDSVEPAACAGGLVIAPVGEQATERVGCLDQRLGHADVVDVAGAEHSTCRLPREGLSLGRSSPILRQQPSGVP